MAKKNTDTNPQQSALEAKVDAMMDVNGDGMSDPSSSQPIDIFAGKTPPITEPVTAPPLPKAVTPAAPKMPQSVETTPAIAAPTQPADDDVKVPEIKLDTPQSDAAIDDIVAQEADEVLAAQDAGIEAAFEAAEEQEQQPRKRGHPIFWFFIFVLVLLVGLTVLFLTSPGLTPSFLQ